MAGFIENIFIKRAERKATKGRPRTRKEAERIRLRRQFQKAAAKRRAKALRRTGIEEKDIF